MLRLSAGEVTSFIKMTNVSTQADFLMVAVLEAAISIKKKLGLKKEGGVLILFKVPSILGLRRHCLSGTHTQTQPVLLKDT